VDSGSTAQYVGGYLQFSAHLLLSTYFLADNCYRISTYSICTCAWQHPGVHHEQGVAMTTPGCSPWAGGCHDDTWVFTMSRGLPWRHLGVHHEQGVAIKFGAITFLCWNVRLQQYIQNTKLQAPHTCIRAALRVLDADSVGSCFQLHKPNQIIRTCKLHRSQHSTFR